MGIAALGLMLWAAPAHAQFVVTSTGDAGGVVPLNDATCDSDPTPAVVCTLRAAIDEANNTPGADLIHFSIGGGGAQVITPGSSYTITQQVTIDGTTQPGYAGTPLIEINGSGPGTHGINVSAGTNTVIRGLVIAQFTPSAGIRLLGGSGTVVAGNYIGTDQSGTLARPNNPGIYIQTSTGNTIGGTAAGDRNVISANASDGIQMVGAGATGNVVQGNYIGLRADGLAALGNSATGIAIFGGAGGNTVGGTSAAAMNVISGNPTFGVSTSGATGVVIQGNRIGTDANGANAVANGIGISLLAGSNSNTIGGSAAGAGNLISGNSGSGILIDSSNTNTIQQNRIGTNAAGTATVPNGQHGIQLSTGASGNIIGGTPAAGNLLSGNGLNGIDVVGGSSGNSVRGNLIGVNAAGTAALANSAQGIALAQGSANNTVGDATGRNVISGNGQHGVRIVDNNTNNNLVQNNYIGLNLAGTAAIGNTNDGVILDAGTGASGNTIGGVGLGNVISGNGGVGVRILNQMTGTLVVDNIIGRNAADSANVANSSGGVRIQSSSGNTIGGTAANAGNVIAGNSGGASGDGVAIVGASATGNAILGNSIYSNAGLGIDLGDDGVTGAEVDLNDADTGPNNHQNTVKLSAVTTSGTWVHIAGSLDAVAGVATYRVEFFSHGTGSADPTTYGEGRDYLGFVDVTTDANGDGIVAVNLNFPVSTSDYVTATVTDAANNTSEFSQNYNAQGDLIVTTTADVVDGTVTSIGALIMNTGADERISLREAILATNATAGADTILFGIPLTDAGHLYYQDDSTPSSLPAPTVTTLPDTLIFNFDADYATGYARSWYRIQPNGSALPQISESTVVDAGTQPGHSAGRPVVELEGSLAGASADGLSSVAAPTSIKDFIINGFTKDGLNLHNSGGYAVTGCHIGIDASGTKTTVGNATSGIFLGELGTGAATTIGGTTAGERNVISANGGRGIYVWAFGAPGIDSQVIVRGNYIGTDVTGTVGLGTQVRGVTLEFTRNHVIGGSGAGEGNVISGNAGFGVELNGNAAGSGTGADDNLIEGNLIGTNAAGTGAVPNSQANVIMFANSGASPSASNNTVRGNVLAAAGGFQEGVRLAGNADGNTIESNYIGTDSGNTVDLGNAGHGVLIQDSLGYYPQGNLVRQNVIRFNDSDGVAVLGNLSTATITQNQIYDNDGLGIDLENDGHTANDLSANDSDIGGNTLLNYPMLGYPMESGGTITVNYQIDTSSTPSWYRVEFFTNAAADPTGYGEGQTFVSSVIVNHTGGRQSYSHSFAGSAGQIITATATACSDAVCTTPASTSEFGWARAALATAVELLSFEARGVDGAVELGWETGSELNNLGFHLYRGPSETGPWTGITESLIPGLGSSPMGARYSFRDQGLANGVTYHYLLEDVETTGRVERHGPVRATPTTGGESEDPIEPEEGEESPAPRIAYGAPESNSLRIVRETGSAVVLELVTEGFYATAQEDGTVLLEVPGFEALSDVGWPSLPVKRSWVDAVVGRRVELGSVQARRIEGFAGLRPSDAAAPRVEVLEDGTIRAGQRRARRAYRQGEALFPEQAARLVEVAFQGERKRAFVELAPLRWDGGSEQLLLAKTLRVKVSFQGREDSEVSLGGSRGRRRPRGEAEVGAREVVARLGTTAAGLYGVRFEEVFPGRRQGVRTNELRLSRQGETVACRVEPDPKRYGPGSVLYFVSQGGQANPWGSEAVYELELGAVGVAMAERSAAPQGPTRTTLWRRGSWEQTRYYQAALLEAEEPWFWARIFDHQVWSSGFELPSLAVTGEPAVLEVWLQGGSDFAADPDHHVRVRVNGTPVSEASWDGQAALKVEASVPAGVLVAGSNLLEIENAGDTGASSSLVYVDRFSVGHPSALVADAGILEGRFPGSGRADIEGLGSSPLLLDTTDAASPQWLSGAAVGAGSVSLRVEAGASYLAVAAGAVKSPTVRLATANALLGTRAGAEYLLVGPRDYVAAAAPLLELRRAQGLAAEGVAIEDVFDAFGYGETRPQALVDFLRHAYHDWSGPSLRYVVLLGDASLDPQDLLGTGIANPVPAPMIRSTFMWTASDLAYAAVNGDDDLPDVALGRLSASTVEEARALVEKLVAWESRGEGLAGPAVIVADNPDLAGDFEGDARLAAAFLRAAGREVEEIYLSEQGSAARASIRAGFDRGASLVSYLGHGALSAWASENVFNRGDVATLLPQAQQPLVLTMNCLNGYFVPPATDSLSEVLAAAEGKGAIAAFAPSGLSIHDAAVAYHDALLAELASGRHHRLGDALLAAQLAYADTGALPELLRLYHLFGDPALTLN